MQKFRILFLTLLFLIPQTGKGIDLPFILPPEKEAQTFVDKVLPEIVTNWEEMVLVRYAHPEFHQTFPRDRIEELFFSCRQLGHLQTYRPAKGEIMEVKTSNGKKYTNGRYVAEADFEKGTASIHVAITKENHQWMITAFHVNPKAFEDQGSSKDTQAKNGAEPNREEMEKAATAFLLEPDIVGNRREVDKIFPIARRLAAEGNKKMAMQLYEKALTADPANFNAQWEYANLLLTQGNREKAKVVLHLIQDLAEDAELLAQTEKALTDLGAAPSPPSCPTVVDAEIILVPVGNPDPKIIQELCPKLQKSMGMTIRIENRALPPGKPDRKMADRYISTIFQNINDKISILQKETVMAALSLDENALQTPFNQSRFLIKTFSFLGQTGEEMRRTYEANLLQMGEEGQYDCNRLIMEIRQALPFDQGKKIKAIIGVTDKDLFMGEGNFVYGGTSAAYGVISYYRYTAAANQEKMEKQNRPRLINRLLKQSLSSVNFALGIPRCNTPSCARSFPQNIAEHDAKGEDLCDECKKRLESFKKDPQNKNIAYEYFALGDKYRNERKWEQAAAFYTRAIDFRVDQTPAAHYGLGETYFEQKRYVEADTSYQRFLELSAKANGPGQDLPTFITIGYRFLQVRQFTTAGHYCSRALKADEQHIEALICMGDIHTGEKEYDKAETYYQRAIEIEPNGFLANIGMAYYRDIKGNSMEAIRYYEKALAQPAMESEKNRVLQARYNLSRLYSKQGMINKEEKQLEEALAINPAFTPALIAIGRIYGKNGVIDGAIIKFQTALEITPDDAETLNDLGYTYYLKKEHRKAIGEYEKAIKIAPNSGLYHYNKALAHFALQEFDLAILHADKAKKCGYAGSPKFHQMLLSHRK